jgi:hypothetical protein
MATNNAQNPQYIQDNNVQNDLQIARSGTHVAAQDQAVLGFTNGITGFHNSCFRSALMSMLLNLQPFAGWANIVDHRGVAAPPGTVLALLWRLADLYWQDAPSAKKQKVLDKTIQNLQTKVNEIFLLKQGGRLPEQHEDAVEFFEVIMDEFVLPQFAALPDSHHMDVYNALMRPFLIPYYTCLSCDTVTRAPPNEWLHLHTLKLNMTRATASFDELVRTAFEGNDSEPGPRNCGKCFGLLKDFSGARKVLNPSEVVLLDVPQTEGKKKLHISLPDIPEVVDLTEYLEPDTQRLCGTLRYRYAGALHHGPGHYVSHVKRPDKTWVILDDAAIITDGSVNIQGYVQPKGNFFPRVLAFVRIHDLKIPTIPICEATNFEALRAHCKEWNVNLHSCTNPDKIRIALDFIADNPENFDFRTKAFITDMLDRAGENYRKADKKEVLAKQLTRVLNDQRKRKTAREAEATAREKRPDGCATGTNPPVTGEQDPPTGGQQDLQQRLDAAIARITALKQSVADLRRNAFPAEGESVTTDFVRELARRLPATASTPRGTKRPVDDCLDGSSETKKCRVFRHFEDMCRGIDLTAAERAGGTTGGTPDPNNENNNVTPERNGNGQTHGPNNQTNNVTPESTGNRQDENQENRPPGGQGIQTIARPDGRCHPCPQFDNEIHHMCASVCGRGPRLITIHDSEQAEEDRRLLRQYGAVRYTRFGPPFRGPPWPPALWNVYAWDMIPDPNDPTRLSMRPVREGARCTPEPVGSPSVTRSLTQSPSNQTASPPDMFSQITNFGFVGYVPTPIQMRNRGQRTTSPRTSSLRNTAGSTGTSPLNVNLTQSPPRSSASGSLVTVYDTTFNNDRFTFSVSPLNPGVEFSPLQLTPIVLIRRAQSDDEETSPTNYDAEDSEFLYTLRLTRDAGSTPAALTTRRPPRLMVRGSPRGEVTVSDEGFEDAEGEVGEPTFIVEFINRDRKLEIPEDGDRTGCFLGRDEHEDEEDGDIILGIPPRNPTLDIDYEEEVGDGLPGTPSLDVNSQLSDNEELPTGIITDCFSDSDDEDEDETERVPEIRQRTPSLDSSPVSDNEESEDDFPMDGDDTENFLGDEDDEVKPVRRGAKSCP